MNTQVNTTTEHGPLPWVADVNDVVVVDAYGNVVADCDVETFRVERVPNAELIALACNSHHKLVEALKRLVDVSAVACILNETHCQIRADVWSELCRASRMAQEALGEAETRTQPAPLR